jgi:hypothetical protein
MLSMDDLFTSPLHTSSGNVTPWRTFPSEGADIVDQDARLEVAPALGAEVTWALDTVMTSEDVAAAEAPGPVRRSP